MWYYVYINHKEDKCMEIAIATNSTEKISGIREAFFRFFEKDISVLHIKTDSEVSEQPFNEEIYVGAKNRVNNLIKRIEKDVDFYISCEAGIESFMGNYFNVQVVCIFDSNAQTYLWGKSAGWQIPSKDIQIIQESTLDNYLRQKGISRIEQLLETENSRKSAVEQATKLALCSSKLL